MLHPLPPPVFKYDIANLQDMNQRIRRWWDFDTLPKLMLRNVIVGEDAIMRLPNVLAALGVASHSAVLAVMDSTEMYRGGKNLKPLILSLMEEAGYTVERLVLEGDAYGVVHADFDQVETVLGRLRPGLPVVVVGSGVVTDVCKHACFLFRERTGGTDLPLVACMTACSAPAYTSGSAIIAKDGVKRTWPSRTPDVIVMDLQTLADSPYTFTLGGIGDTFPVFVAFADWYLADFMGFGSIVDASWRIYDDIRELLLPYQDEIARKSSVGMEVLGKCIHNVGLSMSYARDTVSASGYEHIISHMLDMTAEHDGRKVGIHGQQIGVSVLLTLLHFDKLIERMDRVHAKELSLDTDACFPGAQQMKARVMETFSPFGAAQANECWNDFSIKLEKWHGRRGQIERLITEWPEHKAALQAFLPHSALRCAIALEAMKHPLLFEELSEPVSEFRARWAMRNANLMRKRFTSADLACFLGWLDDAWVDDVFARLHAIARRVHSTQGAN
jgi:glycerol-1-phosphate dehydrogenase [NAD(P)+]